MPEQIKVEGLSELRAAVKELGDAATSKEFKQAGYNVATNIVVPKAQANAGGLGRMEARAAASLKPSKVATGGAVRLSGVFSLGAEFGAGRNIPRQTARGIVKGWNQFKPWRGNGDGAGYFLWPAVRDNSDEILTEFDRSMEPLYKRLFPD